MLQVKITRRVPAQIDAGQQSKPATNTLDVGDLAAEDVAGFTLLNEAVAEIGAQRKSVVAIEAREGELPLLAELPVVGRDQEECVRAVQLPIVNGIVGNRNVDRNQPWDIRETVIADAEQS